MMKFPSMPAPPRNGGSDLIIDHRARLERERLEAVQRRENALLEQRSLEHSAATRVRLWERLHQVRLPRDPAHPILAVVARQTSLQLADVLEILRERAESPAPG